MIDTNINYIGPPPRAENDSELKLPLWRKVPLGFLLVVAAPTLITAFFFFFLAAPRYVSESRFIVRSPERQASTATLALQGVGIASGQTDSFAVHEYVTSRDALEDLQRNFGIEVILGRGEGDVFFRYPRWGETRSQEGLHKAFQRFVQVGYDSTTGISTLRVEAFRADDAHVLNAALLAGGERLINRLNERSGADTIREAQSAQEEAQKSLADVRQKLTTLRNREGFVDPSLAVSESSELIAGIRGTIATLSAERDQLLREAPASPTLPALTGRIAALEAQVAAERRSLAGSGGSLAPQVGAYQDLLVEREIADRQLALATASLISARQDATRQQLYLERVVNPSRPDVATLPNRWRAILTVLISSFLVYAIGWLIWAGVREHRQD